MNILLIVAGLVLIWRVVEGFRVGMIREIISFVSLIIMSIAIVLLAIALGSYLDKQHVKMLVALILFLALCIVHKIISFIFFSAKMISKLPVVHTADRLLGGVLGALETIIIIWVLYAFVMTFGLGSVGEQIMTYVRGSKILTILYEHNYLAYAINLLSQKNGPLPFNFEDLSEVIEAVGDTIQEEIKAQ